MMGASQIHRTRGFLLAHYSTSAERLARASMRGGYAGRCARDGQQSSYRPGSERLPNTISQG
jgi:hypothetical protein